MRLLHPLTLLTAVASLALLSPTPTSAQSPATNSTAAAPTQDPRCSQHRSRDACDAAQPFSATSRCQWRFGACVRAAYCSPADCSGTPNPNCDQCTAFGNWCRSKTIGCPTACDRITVQADCTMWASANNGVPSCRWTAGRCAMVNPWAAAVQRPPAQPTHETRAAVVPGGGNTAGSDTTTGPSTTTTTGNSNNGGSSPPSTGPTTQATQKNEQYVVNSPKLVPGILGGAAVVAVAGMVYIMRPNHPAAGQPQSSPIAVPPKPFNPATRPPPPLKKSGAARNNANLHANRSPRPSAAASPMPQFNNNSLHPSSAANARRGVVRKPSSLRMGVSADGSETSSASPRSAPASPHISPLASPALTPGVVTTKTIDGKLTVLLAPSPQVSPQLSPMLSPTPSAVATRTADGKLTVSLAGSQPPRSPTFSALPSPTLAGPTSGFYQPPRSDFDAPATSAAPMSISTPPPPTAAPTRNHSIRSHVSSVSPPADRASFPPEMLLASQSHVSPPATPLAPSPASSLMLQALMDDLNAAAAAHATGGSALPRQGSVASSVDAAGAPVRGTSASATKPSHF